MKIDFLTRALIDKDVVSATFGIPLITGFSRPSLYFPSLTIFDNILPEEKRRELKAFFRNHPDDGSCPYEVVNINGAQLVYMFDDMWMDHTADYVTKKMIAHLVAIAGTAGHTEIFMPVPRTIKLCGMGFPDVTYNLLMRRFSNIIRTIPEWYAPEMTLHVLCTDEQKSSLEQQSPKQHLP